jgi:hypothetical protein
MSLELICPFCGHPNGLGKIFCASCGQNMQQGDKAPKIVGKGQRSGAGRVLGSLFKMLILLALAGFVVGIFWPSKTPALRRAGTDMADDLKAFQEAYKRFEADLPQVKSGAAERAVLLVTETQMNAYLKDALDKNNDRVKARGAMTPYVTDVRADFREGSATLFLAYKVGPASMTYEVMIDPGTKADGFDLRITGARIGHLPLPGAASTLAVSKFRALQKGLRTIDYVVQNAAAWQFKNDPEKGDFAAIAFMKTKPQPKRESP